MLSKLRSDNFCLHSYNAIRADSVALFFKKIFAAEKIRRIILGEAENICFSVHNFNTIRASLQTEFLLLTKGTGTEMQPKRPNAICRIPTESFPAPNPKTLRECLRGRLFHKARGNIFYR